LDLFELVAADQQARAGYLHLPSGLNVETPVFMPVGTPATVKTFNGQIELSSRLFERPLRQIDEKRCQPAPFSLDRRSRLL